MNGAGSTRRSSVWTGESDPATGTRKHGVPCGQPRQCRLRLNGPLALAGLGRGAVAVVLPPDDVRVGAQEHETPENEAEHEHGHFR